MVQISGCRKFAQFFHQHRRCYQGNQQLSSPCWGSHPRREKPMIITRGYSIRLQQSQANPAGWLFPSWSVDQLGTFGLPINRMNLGRFLLSQSRFEPCMTGLTAVCVYSYIRFIFIIPFCQRTKYFTARWFYVSVHDSSLAYVLCLVC